MYTYVHIEPRLNKQTCKEATLPPCMCETSHIHTPRALLMGNLRWAHFTTSDCQ